jgi:hypothetical protein
MNQGVTGASSAARSFSKLNQTIGQGNGGLVGAYATLAANAFAVSAAFNALRSAAQTEQLLQGLEVQGAKTGRTLTTVAANIQEITEGSISAAEAMQAAALGSSAGLTAGDLEKLTQVATNASKVLGRNLPDSMDRVIKGVTKLEPELLDELGLMTKLTEASEAYARQQGKSAAALTNFEKRRAFVDAIAREGELKFGGIEGQIDPNQFDRLAAAFQNLTQSVLSFIGSSKSVGLILDNLTETSTGLLGAIALFASTIRRQLLGSFAELTERSTALANKAKEDSDKLVKASSKALEKNKNAIIKSSKDLESAFSLDSVPKKVAIISKELINGTATVGQYDESIKSLTRSQKLLNTSVNKETDPQEKSRLQDRVTARQFQIEALEKSRKVSEKNIASEKALAAETDKASLSAANAARVQGESAAFTAASNFKIKEAINQTIVATKAYGVELKAKEIAERSSAKATNQSISVFDNLVFKLAGARTAVFGFTTAVKIAGTAILSALPYFGALMSIISIGEMVFDFLTKSDADKARKKAFEELGEVIESTTAKNKEYLRVLEAEAQIGEKTLQANIIRANSLKELAEAYIKTSEEAVKAQVLEDKLAEARAKAAALPTAFSRVDVINNPRQSVTDINVAEAVGVDPNDPALKNTFKLVEGSFFGLGRAIKSFNEDQINALKALKELTSASPELAEAFAKKTLAVKTFSELTKVATELLVPFAKQQGVLADSLGNLQAQFQATDQAFANFSRSIKPTTPYDQMAEGLIGLNQALDQVSVSLKKSGLASDVAKESFDNIVTGIGENISTRLMPATQLLLRSFNSIGTEIDTLTKLQGMANLAGDTAKVAELQTQINALEGSRTNIRSNLATTIRKELTSTEALVLKTQENEVTLQSSLALQQANLAVLQRRGIITASDVEKQINAQNAIIVAQVDQIKNKLTLARAELNSLEVSKQQLAIQKELISAIKGQTVAKQEEALGDKLKTTTDPTERAALKGLLDTLAETKSPLDPDQIDAAMKQTEKAFRLQQAGVKQLETSAKATSLGILTNAEKESQKEQANIANKRTANSLVQERLNLETSNTQIESRLQDVREGGLNTLSLELKAIDDNAKRRKDQLKSEQDLQLLDLERQKTLAQKTGNKKQVEYFTDLINKTKTLNDTQLKGVDLAAQEERLNKIGVKNAADALQIVQQTLEVYQRRVDLARELVDQEAQIFRNRAEIDILRSGGQLDERSRKALEVDVANIALQSAIDQNELRNQSITMEFALLKAQRELQLIELKTKEKELRAKNPESADIILAGIQNLENFDYGKLEGMQRKQAENVVKIARQGAQRAAEEFNNTLRPGNFAIGAFKNLALRLAIPRRAQQDSKSPLPTVPGQDSPQDVSNKKPFDNVKLSFMEVMDVVNTGIGESMRQFEELSAAMSERLGQDFGPQGKIIQALASAMDLLPQKFNQISTAINDIVNINKNKTIESMDRMSEAMTKANENIEVTSQTTQTAQDKTKEGFKSQMQAASSAFSAISSIIGATASILKASSDAKMAGIDKEIAAEQKRDGKSAESVAKIAGLEKKKDEMGRKSFNIQKKLMMAQAVMSTAAGVTMALASAPSPFNFILAGITAAMGAAQIAIISGMQYNGGAKSAAPATPSTLSIGKRSDTVDLARGPSANAGGEVGFLRGSQGMGTNASNFRTIGSAYGGELMRGYGNRGFVVGEKGPEVITPETPINVTPANDVMGSAPVNATINIQALDASGVENILVSQKGNIIKMLRQAANASGQGFLEDVNVNVYTRPNVNRL